MTENRAPGSGTKAGLYMPPLLEALGLAEVEHNPKNNRMRAR
jgi:hypothetical protein